MKKIDILLAMRDAWTAESLRRALDDGERVSVRACQDGEKALMLCRRLAPDILVIDAVLPGVDGLGVADRLRAALGGRMPAFIGGAQFPAAREGFLRRGAEQVLPTPWDADALFAALRALIERERTRVDWEQAERDQRYACQLLRQMGMRERLRGFSYLAWAAALAYGSEDRLFSIGETIYAPIAGRFGTTPQNVERLIRHAVESAMDAVGARGVYGFFGNTIDPTRGKPTNGQMIGMLVQRMRVR